MTQPAVNRVLQAMGRPIRGIDDRAVVLLLDKRCEEAAYRTCFPEDLRMLPTSDPQGLRRSPSASTGAFPAPTPSMKGRAEQVSMSDEVEQGEPMPLDAAPEALHMAMAETATHLNEVRTAHLHHLVTAGMLPETHLASVEPERRLAWVMEELHGRIGRGRLRPCQWPGCFPRKCTLRWSRPSMAAS